jgi:adenosylhomocysteinase
LSIVAALTPDIGRTSELARHGRFALKRECDFLDAVWRAKPGPVVPARISIIIVCHLIADTLSLISFLHRNFELEAVIPKPRSIDPTVERELDRWGVRTVRLDREMVSRFDDDVRTLLAGRRAKQLIIIDMGGYFSRCLDHICDELGDDLLGVVEDTENGLRKYLSLPVIPAPFYSVAASALKRPENRLVGQSLLDGIGKIVQRNCLTPALNYYGILGFGRIGSEIADVLARRGTRFSIFDSDPIKLVHAQSLGYPIASRSRLLSSCGIILCVTGNRSLRDADLDFIKSGAILASITSADDEFDFSKQLIGSLSPFSTNVDELLLGEKRIFFLNGGNALNFATDPNIGASIALLQGEIILSIKDLMNRRELRLGCVGQISEQDQRMIAGLWIDAFMQDFQ